MSDSALGAGGTHPLMVTQEVGGGTQTSKVGTQGLWVYEDPLWRSPGRLCGCHVEGQEELMVCQAPPHPELGLQSPRDTAMLSGLVQSPT